MHALSESIQQTVRDFHSGSTEWEGDFLSLLDDVARFLESEGRSAATPVAVTVAEDVAGLKGLVEQQTEVLTALVNALTGPAAASEAS